LDGSDCKEGDSVLLGELLLYYFEWMSANKATDACAKGVHGLLSMLLPANSHIMPKWATLKRMLEQVHKNNVEAVHLCPNDHVAFVDCTHPKLAHYQHADRTVCPHPGCGAHRYVTNQKGQKKPAKVGFYFPLDPFLHDLFKDPDLCEHAHQNVGQFPPGHTRHSKGWYDKMTNNPHMNGETRNQALIGMADGIPLFKDKHSRSCVPVAVRLAGQPDSVSKKFNNIHLAALYPCDFWVKDRDTGMLKRERHKPSNIGALLILLVQDLLYWYTGKAAIDYNLADHDPNREFVLRAILLFWCGDYPGLGEVTNFSHSGYNACHWCKEVGYYSNSLKRMVYGRYKRYTRVHVMCE
jgi:hypothetical protein